MTNGSADFTLHKLASGVVLARVPQDFTLVGSEMHEVSFCGVSHNLICDGATLQRVPVRRRRGAASLPLPREVTGSETVAYHVTYVLSYLLLGWIVSLLWSTRNFAIVNHKAVEFQFRKFTKFPSRNPKQWCFYRVFIYSIYYYFSTFTSNYSPVSRFLENRGKKDPIYISRGDFTCCNVK